MGQKVHPVAFRMQISKAWSSRWFAKSKNYSALLLEDVALRRFLMPRLRNAGVSKVEIERNFNQVNIIIYVSKPGMVIGRGGAGIEELKKLVEAKVAGKVKLDIQEVANPDVDAYLIGRSVADQIERRMPAKRVMNQAVEKAKKSGVKVEEFGFGLPPRVFGRQIAGTLYSINLLPIPFPNPHRLALKNHCLEFDIRS